MERDEYYMRMAESAALRSTCPRASVGAVLTLDRVVISTGYNGAPRGLAHCTDVGCGLVTDYEGPRQRCVRAVHAEANALIHSLQRGSVAGSVLYTTHMPCLDCAKLIINARVSEVVFSSFYADSRVLTLKHANVRAYLQEAGVLARYFHLDVYDKTPVGEGPSSLTI